MAKKNDKVENLANATPEYLIDEIGDLRAQLKPLVKREKILTEALKARVTKNAISGERWEGLLSSETQVRISADAVRELLADRPDDLKKVVNEIQMTKLSVTKRLTAEVSGK